jgi:hypothetical protein
MRIENSLHWAEVSTQLYDQLYSVGFNPDLHKLIGNINVMIVDLSRHEVEARRIKKPEYTKDKVEQINKAIDHLEKLLLIAQLMK